MIATPETTALSDERRVGESEGRFSFYGIAGQPGWWRVYREIEGAKRCLGKVERGRDNVFTAYAASEHTEATGFRNRRNAAEFLLSAIGGAQ